MIPTLKGIKNESERIDETKKKNRCFVASTDQKEEPHALYPFHASWLAKAAVNGHWTIIYWYLVKSN